MQADDTGCYISFQQSYESLDISTNSDNSSELPPNTDLQPSTNPQSITKTSLRTIRAYNSLGPVLPGPPRLLDVRICGNCVEGGIVYVDIDYIGGKQGPSEYWWFKIKGGKRIQVNEPTAVDPSTDIATALHSYTSSHEAAVIAAAEAQPSSDPRVLRLTCDDVGCVLKVKCRPIRDDGYKGEVFTSKPSDLIVSAVTTEQLRDNTIPPTTPLTIPLTTITVTGMAATPELRTMEEKEEQDCSAGLSSSLNDEKQHNTTDSNTEKDEGEVEEEKEAVQGISLIPLPAVLDAEVPPLLSSSATQLPSTVV